MNGEKTRQDVIGTVSELRMVFVAQETNLCPERTERRYTLVMYSLIQCCSKKYKWDVPSFVSDQDGSNDICEEGND